MDAWYKAFNVQPGDSTYLPPEQRVRMWWGWRASAEPAARTMAAAVTATVHPLRRQREPSLDPMVALIADDMNAVNSVILDRMQTKVALIPELAGHLIAGGGKRMRPMLTLASRALLDYTGTRHHKLAAAVEFIHTATLLHDDVVDGSGMRRGKRTANLIWGNPASVLVGDFLFSRAFELMVEDGSLKVLKILSHASAVIAEGEVEQLPPSAGSRPTRSNICRSSAPRRPLCSPPPAESRRSSPKPARKPKPRSKPTAAISASPSSSSTTRSIMHPMQRPWARASATISATAR